MGTITKTKTERNLTKYFQKEIYRENNAIWFNQLFAQRGEYVDEFKI